MDAKTPEIGGEAALLILPGLLCDSRMFGETLAAIPGARVVDGFYGGADRIAAMADHVIAHMPDRCALLGHSMGARVALEVVRKVRDRVDRLALADTGVHPVRPGEREGRYRLRDIGRTQGMAALVAQWLPPMMGFAALRDAALMDRLYAMCVSAGLPIFEAQIAALLERPSVDTLLPAIACPTDILVGRQDQWSPVAQHEVIAAAIPGARLRVVDHAGHMMPAESPLAFNHYVRDWLDQPAPAVKTHHQVEGEV